MCHRQQLHLHRITPCRTYPRVPAGSPGSTKVGFPPKAAVPPAQIDDRGLASRRGGFFLITTQIETTLSWGVDVNPQERLIARGSVLDSSLAPEPLFGAEGVTVARPVRPPKVDKAPHHLAHGRAERSRQHGSN
jgi:hypothetical protein